MRARMFFLTTIIFILTAFFAYAKDLCYEYVEQREYDKAIEECTKRINSGTYGSATYNNRGRAYNNKGDYDRAMADYNKAIELNPKDDCVYNNRGSAYYEKGDYDRAMADYNKAIELNPTLDKAYYNRGNAYEFKGDYDRAISDYNKAIELNPKNEYSYILLFIASKKVSDEKGRNALAKLKDHVLSNSSSEWVRTISKFYLGMDGLTEDMVLAEARKGKDEKEIRERLCEAYYYLGEQRLWNGNRRGSEEFFNKSIETNVYGFIEYRASKAVLKKMREGKR